MINFCSICDNFVKDDDLLCHECSIHSGAYHSWRKALWEYAGNRWNITLFPGNYAFLLFEKGLTPGQAYQEAKNAFEDYVAADAPEYYREERRWRQLNAGMPLTEDGYPQP